MSNDGCTTCKDDVITLDCTVDDIVARVPAALALLGEYNIDTCCGGRSSLGEAATHAHADGGAVLSDLLAVQSGATAASPKAATPASPVAPSCGCGCR